MTDPKIYKETRHVFNVVFNNNEIVLKNQYRFNCYPIYWSSEVILGKSAVVGQFFVSASPTLLHSGSAVSNTYTSASLSLSVNVSASMTLVSYTQVSASGVSE